MTGEFVYVDSAIGDEDHRNKPVRFDQFRYRADARGVYVTYLQYDRGLIEHHESHLNARGNRTVAGFRGRCTSSIVPFDVDKKNDLGAALDEARRIVRWLVNRWDIPADSLRIIFSGSKGFHVEVWATLFGGFMPCEQHPERLYRLAVALLDGLNADIDQSVYNHLRLWRVPNTIHQNTGCYAIFLNFDELLELDIEAIVALAESPRRPAMLPADEWAARTELVELWRSIESTVVAKVGEAATFAQRIRSGAGRRHKALVHVAGVLRHEGFESRTIGDMLLIVNRDAFDEPASDADVFKIAESIGSYAVDVAKTIAYRLTSSGSPAAYIPSTTLIERPGRPPSVRLGEVVRR